MCSSDLNIFGHTDAPANFNPGDEDFDTLTGSSSGVINTHDNTIVGANTDTNGSVPGGGDTIDALQGDDIIYAGGGDDSIEGNNGDDTIYGQGGNDTLSGSENDDLIYGGSGNDFIQGGADVDSVYGGSGNDTVDGNNGNDVIFGGTGNDSLSGGNNDDTVIGGAGNDTLTGGNNADTFVFVDPATDPVDRIDGFSHADDSLLFNAGVGKYDGAVWVSGVLSASDLATINTGAAPVATDGHHFVFDTSNGSLWYDDDGSGAGAAIKITTVNVTSGSLAADDFLSY